MDVIPQVEVLMNKGQAGTELTGCDSPTGDAIEVQTCTTSSTWHATFSTCWQAGKASCCAYLPMGSCRLPAHLQRQTNRACSTSPLIKHP
jgi:hypothetical protein